MHSRATEAAFVGGGGMDRLAPWVAVGLLAGLCVAALGVMDPVRQTAAVLLIGVGVPAVLLFVARPYLGLAAYLAILPLLRSAQIVAGLNAGEIATAAAILMGGISLWEGRARLVPSLRTLAPIVVPLCALAAVSVVSLLVNGIRNPQEIVSALFKVLAFGFVALVVHIHSDTPSKARVLLRACLLGAVVVAGYAVVAYVLGWSYNAHYDWNRATGTFEHYNDFGGFMALMSMPTLGLALSARRLKARLLYGTGFIVQIVALVMSLTLMSIFSLLIAIGLALPLLFRVSRARLVMAALVLVIGLGVAFAASEPLREKVAIIDERVMDRLSTYVVGARMFSDRIWFGFGSEQAILDQVLFAEADYGITAFGRTSSVPHNVFLRLAVEKGIFGVIAFILLILGAVVILFRDWRRQRTGREGLFYACLVTGVLAYLVQNQTNDLVLHARAGIIFFSMIAIADRLRSHRSAAWSRADPRPGRQALPSTRQ